MSGVGSGVAGGGPGGIYMPPVGGSTDGGAGTGGTMSPGSPGGRAGTSSCSADGGVLPPTMTPGRGVPNLPSPGAMVTAAVAPPAVSGGTLRVLSGGQIAVAADPDRDRVYVVDLSARTVATTVVLQTGDEPGRVIEDAAGRVHVALRHGGAIATFDPRQAQPTVTRRAICASPRGLAYDATGDLVHVACADGELISVPAAGGAAVRSLQLQRDLRDVAVDGSRLRVTRFRSAELLTVEASGTVSSTMSLPSFATPRARSGQMFSAGAAWRMMPTADGGVAVLHQRGVVDTIRPAPGGYGGVNPCDAIVHPAVTTVAPDGTVKTGPALPGLVLAVDMAISPDGAKVAVVSLGNATNQPVMPSSGQVGPQLTRVFVTDMASATDQTVGCKPDSTHGPCLPPNTSIQDTSTGTIMTGCPADPTVVGQPIAVAFQDNDSVVVQSREPAMLTLLRDGGKIDLSGESRADTGHLYFHANAGGFIACASCHLEGNDDGRVWDFGCDVSGNVAGLRRTQSLQTGLRGTEPFHWSGDEANFDALMADVLVGRMSGPKLTSDQGNAMLSWIDAQPRPLRPAPANPRPSSAAPRCSTTRRTSGA